MLRGKTMSLKLSICYLLMLMVFILFLPSQFVYSQDKEVNIALISSPDTMHALKATDKNTHMINKLYTDTLVWYSTDGKVQPQLASKWSYEEREDGLVWVIKIKEDIYWHNGDKLVADHVKKALDFAAFDKESGRYGYAREIKQVEVIDDYTLEIFANQAAFPISLANLMIPPLHVIEEKGEREFLEQPFGTGPYKVIEYVPGEYIRLVANPDWHGYGEDYNTLDVKRAKISFVPEATTRVAGLLSGDFDLIFGVPAPTSERIKESKGFSLYSGYHFNGRIKLALQMGIEVGTGLQKNGLPEGLANPFLDLRVRQAIYHAIDIEKITNDILGGSQFAIPMGNYGTEINLGYEPVERLELDVEKARALMEEAGYPDGFEVRMNVPGDRFVELPRVAQVIQSNLKNIGIQVQIQVEPWAVIGPKRSTSEMAMGLIGSGVGPFEMNIVLGNWFTTGGPANVPTYNNPEFDELYKKADSTLDSEQREELWKEAMRILIEDIPYVPLDKEVGVFAANDDWEYYPHASGYFSLVNVREK